MKNKILDHCDEDTFDIEQKSVLNRKGKDYLAPKKIDFEKIAILAILVIAVGFIFIHVLLEFGVILALLTLVGMYTFYKILSNLIS